MKKLIYAVLLVLLIGIIAWFYTGLNGNPISKIKAEKDMKSYLAETYPGKDFELGEVNYSMSFGAYMARVTSKSDSSISFRLNWRSKSKVFYDEYENKYSKDEVLSKKFAGQITENLNSILKDKITGFKGVDSEVDIKKGAYNSSENFRNNMLEKITVWVDMYGEKIPREEFVDRCIKARELISKEGYNIETYSFHYGTGFEGDVKGEGEELYSLALRGELLNASKEDILKSRDFYENTGKGKMIIADILYKGAVILFVFVIIGAGTFIAVKERKKGMVKDYGHKGHVE